MLESITIIEIDFMAFLVQFIAFSLMLVSIGIYVIMMLSYNATLILHTRLG